MFPETWFFIATYSVENFRAAEFFLPFLICLETKIGIDKEIHLLKML